MHSDTQAYDTFLASKQHHAETFGIDVSSESIHPLLFPFQRDVVRWAVRKGRAAIFLDTGLGKTFVQLEWARLLGVKTLIIAPLSVARQTVRESHKIDLEVIYCRSQAEATGQICITNYEMISHFNMAEFGAVVLDESSILKTLDGKTRKALTTACIEVPFRLCCTATPAPNDHTELGNHAEFLGICTASEMLATYFVNANKEHTYFVDGRAYRRKGSNANGTEWRLKHHAEQPFFRWLASWAIAMTAPSDLGYDDDGFILPTLTITPHFVSVDIATQDELFFVGLHGIADRAAVRRQTLDARLELLCSLVKPDEQWIVWCGLDEESRQATAALANAVEVKGSHTPETKAAAFEAFQDGAFNTLVTKGRIGGFGMNFQNAHHMAFLGLNDSWELFYQCVRREYRFGQTQPVNVHILLSEAEREIYDNIMRKERQARRLRQNLIAEARSYEREELMSIPEPATYYQADAHGEQWTAMLGDACIRLPELADESVDLSVYSPPFSDLFTYTDSERDLGNSRDWDEFFEHYAFIIREILRVTKPGRLTCVHTSDIPALQQKDGWIGVKDFPGAVIRAYNAEGWQFVGRAFVAKNPQAQAIRTKSKALLFVQLAKDSADSRPALSDQILLFKRPGENAVPVTPVQNGEITNDIWIEWASGAWLDIRETDTLQYGAARGADDEKHICPLQLGTVERCIKLWSNPGETVLTPFGGIGTEAYQAIRFGRKAILIELKPEYWQQACKNLTTISTQSSSPTLFDLLPNEEAAEVVDA